MSKNVIEVENLGKCYQIGELEDYYTLRDSLTNIVKYPINLISGNNENEKKSEIEFIWAIKGINFEVKQGEIVGIIGRNGSGKSTLLKILSRITTPTEGNVKINGRVGSLLEVGTGFHPELTGRENIFLNGSILGMSKKEIKRKFDEIVDFAEVEKFLDTPVKRYSSGMHVRLAFAVAAHLDPEILLVDEVLAVGDFEFQKKCIGKIGDVSKDGRTVLFVSHNMGSITSLCQRVIILDKGDSVFDGNAGEGVNHYYSKVIKSNNAVQNNILFELDLSSTNNEKYVINRIEILDYNENPKDTIYTWDDIIFRIYFRSHKFLEKGSVVLNIKSFEGNSLLFLSTQPDSNYPIKFLEGDNHIDCAINNIPLSAGEYFIYAYLAIPNAEYLTKGECSGRLRVLEKDIFNSGLPPKSSRSLIAINHEWRIRKD